MKFAAKWLCLLLVLLMLAGCTAPAPSLREQGMSLIATLDELAGSEACVAFYSASPEINEIIAGAAAAHGAPKAVFAITLNAAPMPLPENLSPELERFLSCRSLGVLVSQLNAAAGVEALAASSICTVSKTFTAPGAADSIYLYLYEDAVPAAVTFTTGENDTVCATATYLFGSRYSLETAEDLHALFGDLAVNVEPVTN